MLLRRAPLLASLLLSFVACGSDRDPWDDANASGGPGASGGPPGGAPGSSGGASGTPGGEVATDLVGVWSVAGKDARGSYRGRAEVRADGGKLTVVRTVAYDGVTVEGGRALHWAFVGTGKGDTKKEITADVTLENRDFIVEREGVVRTAKDAPIPVVGKVRLEAGKGIATWSGTGVTGEEAWESREPSGAEPIVSFARTVQVGHDPPASATKTGLFATYGSFHQLPVVQPYVGRPEFQAAVHGHIVDKTDFAFYRANKNALRVVNKSIDAISLGETLNRANAYRMTLAEKAAGFDAEIETEFTQPQTGMLLDAAPPGQSKQVHFSAALWTGIYMASQVYRFQATGEPKAKANVVRALDGLLKLQEVTGDWKVFARAIRPATGSATGGWHPGAGALASLEWLEGGNNDMMKGLYIAYVLGHGMLCKAPGHEALCARIRANAKHLSDDVNVDRGSDDLDSSWLTAVVTNDVVTKISYQAKAEAAWVPTKPVVENNTLLYEQGTADWSGLNLGFVSGLFHVLLAGEYDVGGSSKATFTKIIDDSWAGLRRQRLPLWNLLEGAYGATGLDAAAKEDTLWRMREFPFPKPTIKVDLRIRPDYCMSPYPSLPWKNDWTTTDRTQALRSVPLFEEALDIYRFRTEMRYAGDTRTARPPAPEYLVAYWFARKHGLLAATD